MSLVQHQIRPRDHETPSIADGVPAPPIELQQLAPSQTVQPPHELGSKTRSTQTNQAAQTAAASGIRVETPTAPIKGTVEVKAHGNILTRLFSVETTSLHKLQVIETEEFEDEEAELKYEKFADFLRTAANDLSSPENDPLVSFRGHYIEHDQVYLQPPDPSLSPLPYIRFIGAKNENEVRSLHASLSKRRFRSHYYPPLRICYVVQELNPLASGDVGLKLLRPSPDTICGALASIGLEQTHRIVTIGGLVESVDASYALTAGHASRDRKPAGTEHVLSPLDINEDEYDSDVDYPLVVSTQQGLTSPEEPLGDEDEDRDVSSQQSWSTEIFGTIYHTGSDWALLKLGDARFALPNSVHEITSADTHDVRRPPPEPERAYFGNIATEAQSGFVRIIAGRSGIKTVQLLRKPANMRHPSGSWLRTWKAKLGPAADSKLKRGDSGAWIVDTNTGTVYGHIMAATIEHVYIQPLVDIFKDIEAENKICLKLGSPFGQLAELAKLYHTESPTRADQFARQAFHPTVLSQSSETPLTSAILSRIQQCHMEDIDIVTEIVMRTGRRMGLGLPNLWNEARDGKLGTPDRALALLTDLSEASGLELPPAMLKEKQQQILDDSEGASISKAISSVKEEKVEAAESRYSAEKEILTTDVTKKSKEVEVIEEKPRALYPTRILRRSYDWLLRTFYHRTMDVTILGLQNCGKTSLLRVLAGGEFTLDSIPTVGFNMKRIERNSVTIKAWVLGGQPRFRPMWERYSRGVNCIVFVVDITDVELMPLAREELHHLMDHPGTKGIPLLVLGNYSERPNAISVDELIDQLALQKIQGRVISCYGISAKEETNLDAVVDWMAQWA